ncbi:MAG: ACP S-malonyltransferase [Deltaproteobacteria bacterium]|nr:ACP S-malonyltransferase [Deltaproteobacteria bacterium]MBW2307124.1 ACP S-malonyltransferase [Deltaproteobacteria bacterium]
MQKVVFLFPGQGSQYVGMGKSLFEAYEFVRDRFREAGRLLDMNFEHLCLQGPEKILIQTRNVQPAITLVNAVCCELLVREGIRPEATAGHSLGEYSALYAAGCLDFPQLMRLVQTRGSYMQEAAEKNPGGMTAVIGLDRKVLEEVCLEASVLGPVEIANINSPDQIIISGRVEALERATTLATERGARRTIPLSVSGAWHSRFMAEAQARMGEELAKAAILNPSIPVVANVTADYVMDAKAIRILLKEQICSPVLWSDSIRLLLENDNPLFVEVGPGQVLRGLVRRISRDAQVMNMESPEDLENIRKHLAI